MDADGRDGRRRAGVSLVALNGKSVRDPRDLSSSHEPIPDLSLVWDPTIEPDSKRAHPANGRTQVSFGDWPDLAIDEVATEQSRLATEIAAAQARLAAARHRAVEVRSALHRDVLAAQQHLADLERNHETTLASIRESAAAEAASIIADARRQVAGGIGPADRATAGGSDHAE